MPKAFSEVSQTSSKGDGDANALAFSRVFRIVLSEPGEEISVEAVCGIYVGDPHPVVADAICTAYDAAFEGSSRLVILVTFNYQVRATLGGSNPGPPDTRPANWTLGSSIYERPVWWWRKRFGAAEWGNPRPAANPVGDLYDGVTTLDAMVTISIQQFVLNDITTHCTLVGAINEETIRLGSLLMLPHTVMLRGVQAQPVVLTWQQQTYRGFNATYEFAYKENLTSVHIGGDGGFNQYVELALGWDIAVPQTGFNVFAFAPNGAGANDDIFGQPLKHGEEGSSRFGVIDDDPYSMPDGVTAGSKVRGMVPVFAYNNGGTSQSPCAAPIPLNDTGRPRKIAGDTLPLVYAYQVHRAVNFTSALQLRLQ